MLDSLFNKVAGLNVAGLKIWNFIKKRLKTQVFSYEYCEIFKNNYFEEHLRTAAPVYKLLKIAFINSIAILQ